jgi:integrase
MRKKRRTRTEHSGVKIIRRIAKGTESWAARFLDPDTGKLTQFTLDALAFPTREARRVWAIRKAKVIATRRAEIEGGAPARRTSTPVETAVEEYLDAGSNRLRAQTLSTYAEGIGAFQTWLLDNAVGGVEQITRAKLTAFRENLAGQPKKTAVAGGTRGERKATTKKRSGHSINKHLRAVKTMLNHWRNRELLPLLDRDAICDSLKNVSTSRDAPAYLPPADCRKLLEAALRHDAESFTATRLEHSGLKPLGMTPRYKPIAPFTLCLLLTGCRLGEVLNLTWQDVDLDALDAEGRKVGEIRLLASATKTKHWRAIGLEVCPSLRTMLAAAKLKAGSITHYVFGGKAPTSKDYADSAKKRLITTYGAPEFTWQNLRQTTGTFLTNAPGIYGSASAFMSARQLGHSVAVAEKHYLGVVRGIPREARTLEQAMQIEDLAHKIVARASGERDESQRFSFFKSI